MSVLRFVHHQDASNAGDMFSTPARYFDWGTGIVETLALREPAPQQAEPIAGLIVGGGGLVGNAHYAAALDAHLAAFQGPRILWGAGHNQHLYPFKFSAPADGLGRFRGDLRAWLVRRGWRKPSPWSQRLVWSVSPQDHARFTTFDLVGSRDWDCGLRWVPCVSCLHPALDRYRDTPPRHDVVFIDHPKFFAIEAHRGPKLSNLENDVDTIVAFLASGRTIVTSSYHAAYWGILLGRKVVVAPWSTKFLRFKWPVELAPDLDGLGYHLARARAFPEALEEARAANLAFAADAARFLGRPTPAYRFSPV